MTWLLSVEGIVTIIQIFNFIVLILSFLQAYRTHVGIIRADSIYDEKAKEFTVVFKTKNTGNVPANNVSSSMKMFVGNQELSSGEGKSRYVLFPGQENSGHPKFNNVEKEHLLSVEFKISVEINYEQPISSFLRIPVTIRKYKSIQEFVYDSSVGKFAATSGIAS